MNARREYRSLSALAAVIAAVALVSSVAGIADHVAAAVLIAAGLGWLAVVALRRERRISARLADPCTRTAPRPPGEAHVPRVGPGDRSPVPPAPTHHPGATTGAAPAAAAIPAGGSS